MRRFLKLRRFRRVAPADAWVGGHPRGLLKWLLRKLGVAWLFWPIDYAGGPLRRLPPIKLARLQALLDPGVVSASLADHMKDDDVVLGMVVNDAARAYPWWIVRTPHVANDTVAGQPVLVVL